MNPNDLGDHIDVEYDAWCERTKDSDDTGCGFEGVIEAEVWIPRFGDDTNVPWVCPDCGKNWESFAFVSDLVW